MNLVIDLGYMIVSWILMLVIRIPLMLMGFVIVPIGLLFKVEDESTIKPFSDSRWNTDRNWMLVTLPKILWIWSNDRDGALGDKRGWWDANCKSGNARDFFSMYHWMAIRNPVNNMRFVKGISCNASLGKTERLLGQDIVKDKVGFSGFQLLKNTGPTFRYYHLYWVKENKDDPTKALIVRMGHKIKISHNDEDWSIQDATKVWKGFTFRVGFNKDIS